MNELVSIIMPVYNCEDVVKDSIMSVLNQSYSNFELIIVNDGSTDDSYKVCELIHDKRIKLYSKKNGGPSSARNFGISKASGEYIMFIDSDDKYLDNSVLDLITCIKKNKCDIVIGNFVTNSIPRYKKSGDMNFNRISDAIDFLLKNKLFNVNWNKIYKKSVIDKYSIRFDEKYRVGEDLRFNLEYFKYISLASFTSKIIYDYAITDSGLTRTNQKEKGIREIELLKYIYSYYSENNFDLKFISTKIAKAFFYIDDVELCICNEDYLNLLSSTSRYSIYSKFLYILLKNKKRFILNFMLFIINRIRG